ncbi:MAG: YceI family protein [Polyangiaceae bacterium]|nr:YceI family protein [Polyangiaceae bacterium]
MIISRKLAVASVLAVSALSFASVGCEDPAQNVASAAVDSAKPVPPPPPAKTQSAAATNANSAAPATTSAPTATATATAAADAKPAKPDGGLDVVLADSKVEFTGSKVTGKHDGKFEKFSGWAYIDGDKLDTARMYVEIEVGSLKSDSEKLDGHLKTDDFFSVEKFPTATFQLTELKKGGADGASHTITGNLKMRGVEKSVSFPAKVTLGKDDVKATAEFKINRKDWGITYEGKKDDLIRDEVVIRLDIHAKK